MPNASIAVFKNGSNTDGKIVTIPDNYDELIKDLSVLFSMEVRRIFSKSNEELFDINGVKKADIIHLSQGEGFVEPKKDSAQMGRRSDWIR